MFWDDIKRELKRKYRKLPYWQRPEIWPLVFNDDRSYQRKWVENTMNHFTDSEQAKLKRRLYENNRFIATYNELCVAAHVSKELHLTYEEHIGQPTPDFTVRNSDGEIITLIEVATKFRPESKRKIEKSWKVLRKLVNEIPIPAAVALSPSMQRPVHGPRDEREAKEIAKEIESWLKGLIFYPEKVRSIRGFEFIYVDKLPGLRARLLPPGGGTWIDSDMIISQINNKVKVYSKSCESMEIPLVVIISKEPEVPLDKEQVEKVLDGVQVISNTVDPFSTSAGSHTVQIRLENTPISFNPCLSAVGFLEPGIDDPGQLKLFPVRSAKNTRIIDEILQ